MAFVLWPTNTGRWWKGNFFPGCLLILVGPGRLSLCLAYFILTRRDGRRILNWIYRQALGRKEKKHLKISDFWWPRQKVSAGPFLTFRHVFSDQNFVHFCPSRKNENVWTKSSSCCVWLIKHFLARRCLLQNTRAHGLRTHIIIRPTIFTCGKAIAGLRLWSLDKDQAQMSIVQNF